MDRLGGQSFALRKARVKEQLLKMAAELLDLYAARAAHPGFVFPEPDETFREFEAEFPYEATPDQAKAIDEVVADMRKGRPGAGGAPMDRLVCGDVGYGKTEVAMRSAIRDAIALFGIDVGELLGQAVGLGFREQRLEAHGRRSRGLATADALRAPKATVSFVSS